ncbi:bifunctional proline dehydrogenase/L-glutamate gamma-semialdehyde dehydrogenase PutA [Motilimonas pumila]|uniref:Bifunctional protein PutA n=1 Tax=Motilimonas pumila TaxID=2303987 RepID=A0A418YAH6_9GAMM|nr:bifunctional proline dehydrogenase/L-glutamate gamma-semialdehyde dehydrogenase PutA [Motilimonas pumila]RJG39526.1 bifunctional proline dehydrogenase/L-glutamate gamma-semialdehyde dehydrogenase PutA [Motilimonas pumila]
MATIDDIFAPQYLQQSPSACWQAVDDYYLAPEASLISQLAPYARADDWEADNSQHLAATLVAKVRGQHHLPLTQAMMQEYNLSSQEGVLLMCIAESLLRIPDQASAQALLQDKLSQANWQQHIQQSDSLLVNASTWGLMLTGKLVSFDQQSNSITRIFKGLLHGLSAPVMLQLIRQAMKVMAQHYVLGSTIGQALSKPVLPKHNYTFDMLGEAALTNAVSLQYEHAYRAAIAAVADANKGLSVAQRHSISVKLSALYCRFDELHTEQVMANLQPRLLNLLQFARAQNVAITIDAEEADRLALTLTLFQSIYQEQSLQGWGQLGLAVQAYSKRAIPVLAWLAALAKQQRDIIPVRLVKGAYWDSEIKHAQQLGLSGYPVFTQKTATDISYLACARYLFSEPVRDLLWPQFATHNAQTVCAIQIMASHHHYEFQRLHGMGEHLYQEVVTEQYTRIYAPIGEHQELLPYLVRRLLENGANNSFVHKLSDPECNIDDLIRHPVNAHQQQPASPLPLPTQIFAPERTNSAGVNYQVATERAPLLTAMAPYFQKQWIARSLVQGQEHQPSARHPRYCPYDTSLLWAEVSYADETQCQLAIQQAEQYWPHWHAQDINTRAGLLNALADELEQQMAKLVALCQIEAGKTLADAVNEVREAVDFCRYYASQAQQLWQTEYGVEPWQHLTFERQGRGVFVCICPWNFPLAILVGQVCAALVSGNCVVVKPAPQTCVIAYEAITLMHKIGVPLGALQLILGDAAQGQWLCQQPELAGVAFTGSLLSAKSIQQQLTQHIGAQPPQLIAETAGINCMIVDSTAHLEQVTADVISGAFYSAGQRCSATRILCVQEDIAAALMVLIQGAMLELNIGPADQISTDIGPLIDAAALEKIQRQLTTFEQAGQLLFRTPMDANLNGHFMAPSLFELPTLQQLSEEIFGPVLFVHRFKKSQLDDLVSAINDSGFGLTCAIHSRNQSLMNQLSSRLQVGNIYLNKAQTGAVVGVQPFGGKGLSGTGPKAGGPHYLTAFSQQYCSSAELLTLGSAEQPMKEAGGSNGNTLA